MTAGHQLDSASPTDRDLVIGLGANLGTPAEIRDRFHAASQALGERLPVASVRRSRLYSSAPRGPIARQPLFVNAAVHVALRSPVTPTVVMTALLDTEAQFGRDRDRDVPQGPRTLDLDWLLWGRRSVELTGPPAVRVPHERLGERRFALAPVADLVADDFGIPGLGRTVGQCLAGVGDQELSVLSDTW